MGKNHLQTSIIPQSNAALKFVIINKSRGYGSDLWKVLSQDNRHYKLRNCRTNEVVTIYQTHCVESSPTRYAWLQAHPDRLP